MRGALLPMSATDLTCSSRLCANAEKSAPLPSPPAIRRTRFWPSARPLRAATVAPTLVAFESLNHSTPLWVATHSQRWGRPPKRRSVSTMAAMGKPAACPRARHAKALAALCEPRSLSSDCLSKGEGPWASQVSPSWRRRVKSASGRFREKVIVSRPAWLMRRVRSSSRLMIMAPSPA